MLKLYGSTTSPFVRRLRILLANTEHEFIDLDIFSEDDRRQLALDNPTLKIPMLEDDGTLLYDSRVIFRYLTDRVRHPELSWEQENILTLIDSANDSLVQMLILKRSGIDTSEDKMYFRVQRERTGIILQRLNEMAKDMQFDQWHYPAICLYCLLDWIEFRELVSLSELDALLAFQQRHKDRIEIAATDPRQ